MDYKDNNRYEVLTKDGFKDFKGIKKSYRDDNFKLYFSDGSDIVVTPEHKLLNDKNDYVYAKDINIGDVLSGKEVVLIDTNVECSNNFYDLIDVNDGHNYITSGVTSHNCAFIPGSTWKEFEDSVFPTVSAIEGSQIIITSTANGLNHFYQMVKGAKNNISGYKYNEMQWWEVPGRDEKWKDEIIAANSIQYFNQNFGNEFLGSSTTLIDTTTLKNLPVEDPIKYSKVGVHGMRVFEQPIEGHNYVIGVDPAKDGLDYFAIQVVDVTRLPFRQVMSANLQMNYLDLALPLYNLGLEYNEAFIIIENNEGAGQSINDMLWNVYEYENLYKDKDKKFYGYRTTIKSRKLMLTQLKALIESDNLIVKDKETQEEFFHFLEIKGKFQADEGYHDDLVMCLGICVSFLNNVKNFEDMDKYVKQLQSKKNNAEEKYKEVELREMLRIGAFEDHSDEQYTNPYSNDLFEQSTGLDYDEIDKDPNDPFG